MNILNKYFLCTFCAIIPFVILSCVTSEDGSEYQNPDLIIEPITEVEEAAGQCDPVGAICGDDVTAGTCIYCAVNGGPCSGKYKSCSANAQCSSYASCEGLCFDVACRTACQNTYPVGWTRYQTLLHCIGCRCQDSCASLGEVCP